MRKSTKFSLMGFVLIFSFAIANAQNGLNPQSEYSPNAQANIQKPGNVQNFQKSYPWVLEFQFPLTNNPSSAGAETDGTNIYVTKWNDSIIWKFDLQGNILDTFSIPGVAGLRDLAYDGTYFYGGASTNVIYKMDFTTKSLVGTISSSTQTVRSISWVPDSNAFWVGNWDNDNFVLVDTGGNTLASIPAATHGVTGIYGSAYDTVSPGGPYLWVINASGLDVEVVQIEIATGTPTGNKIEVDKVIGSAPPGSGGGLFIQPGLFTGTVTLGGVLQNDKVFGYDLASTFPDTVDIGAVDLVTPMDGYFLTNNETVQVVVRNNGMDTVQTYQVAYKVDNGPADTQNVTIPLAPFDKDTITFANGADLSIGGPHSFTIYTILSTDLDMTNDTFMTVVTNNPPINTFPYNQSWEAGNPDWVQPITDQLDWTLNSGSTPSSNTGPTAAQDSTTYMYIEASGATPSDTAFLWAPFDFTGMVQPKLKFYYHMYGATMGSLAVDVYNGANWIDSIWYKAGDQGNNWFMADVDLSQFADSSAITLRFTAVRGANWASDIAIDNITVYQPVPDDAGVTMIMSPNNDTTCMLSSSELVTVKIENFGLDTISNFSVSYMINSGTPVTETFTGSILGGQTANYTFSANANLSAANTYDITAFTGLAGDGNHANDSAMTTVVSSDGRIIVELFTDDYGDETTWEIVENSSMSVIASGGPYDDSMKYEIPVCVDNSKCYSFVIYDSWGDGISAPGYYKVWFNDVVVAANYSFASATDSVSFCAPVAKDAGVIELISPLNACMLTNSEIVTVKIRNHGADSISNFPVSYVLDNGTPVTETITQTLASGDTVTHTFTTNADLSTSGLHTFDVYTGLTNDGDNTNDTLTTDVTHIANIVPPAAMGFEPNDDQLGWVVVNANNDGNTWTWVPNGQNPNNGTGYYYYPYNTTNNADDWLITKCIELDASKTYQGSFYYKARSASYDEAMDVYIGTSQDPADLTTQIADLPSITNDTYQQYGANFTVPTTGVYYIGFHVKSQADKWNLYLDDVAISDVTGIDEKEVKSINVFPNPTSGYINISAINDEVKNVKIYNTIGQLVESRDYNDSYIHMNIENLNTGVYILQIETKDGFITKKMEVL